jgi:hypothetical protein
MVIAREVDKNMRCGERRDANAAAGTESNDDETGNRAPGRIVDVAS